MPKSKNRRQRSRRRFKRRMRKIAPLAMAPRYFPMKLVGIQEVTGSLNQVLTGSNHYAFARFDFGGITANVIGVNNTHRWG